MELSKAVHVLHANTCTWDLAHWPILRRPALANLLCRVSRFYVFGSGDSVILLTDDNRVFVFGENRNGQLGLGFRDPICEPSEWTTLRGVRIEDVTSGDHHLVLLTGDGDLLGTGMNVAGQLGQDPFRVHFVNHPTVIWKRVKACATGQCHTCVLDFDAKLWCMGHPCPDGTCNSTRTKPYQLPVNRTHQITSIHSTASLLLALTSTQQHIYLWLHDHRKSDLLYPLVVATSTWTIRQLVPVAEERFLLLDTSGRVHHLWKASFGFTLRSRWFELDEPVHQITGCWKDSIAVLRTRSEMLYLYASGSATPLITASPIDAYALYSHHSNSPTLTSLPQWVSYPVSIERLNHFNDPSTSDFTLFIHLKPIFIHRSVMKKRIASWHYLANQADCRLDLYQPEPEWYSVYFAYLLYLYTGRFEPERHWALLLYHLAIVNQNANLASLCRAFLLRYSSPFDLARDFVRYHGSALEHFDIMFASLVTVDNCCHLYEMAFELRLKTATRKVRSRCAETFYRHYEWIITNNADFYRDEMNVEVISALLRQAMNFAPGRFEPRSQFDDYFELGYNYELDFESSPSSFSPLSTI